MDEEASRAVELNGDGTIVRDNNMASEIRVLVVHHRLRSEGLFPG
jgi:hypothetical protein